jgi:hypothetical protein
MEFLFPFTVHFISIKPVLSDHLSYATIFHCSLRRSHKKGLAVKCLDATFETTIKIENILGVFFGGEGGYLEHVNFK